MKNQLGWYLIIIIYFQCNKFILATLRVAGSLAKSTEVMQAMQRLVRVPEVAQTMQDMSKEMMKAGIIEEMLDETFEDMEDQEELEDAAQVEVCKLISVVYCLEASNPILNSIISRIIIIFALYETFC